VEQARKQLARDLITEIRGVDARMVTIAKRMSTTLAEYGNPTSMASAPSWPRASSVEPAEQLAFPSTAAFASYAGVAPVEVASADRARHRLSRAGDRQLNCALHLVAVTQVRMPTSKGPAYYDTKRAAGKTHKRPCAASSAASPTTCGLMVAGERHRRTLTGPEGHTGTTMQSSAAGSTPTTKLFGQVTSRTRHRQATTRRRPTA
jgi:transposase